MDPFIPFAFIVLLGLLIPELFHSFKVTPVPLLIIAGIVIGPHGLKLIEIEEGLEFVADLGLLFLIFIAGLEIQRSKHGRMRESLKLVFATVPVCFAAGFLLGVLFDFPLRTNVLLGAIFVSSSVAEIIPIIDSTRSLKEKFGSLIVPALIIMDATSLVIFSLCLKLEEESYKIILFLISTSIFIISSSLLIPKLGRWFFRRYKKSYREVEVRFILATLFCIVAISIWIDLHYIVAAFLAGVYLGETIPDRRMLAKLEGIGYGLLIPIFFIYLGLETDIGIMKSSKSMILTISVVITLVASKIFGGILYSFVKKIPLKEGALIGIVLVPQLSATLAATAIGREAGIIGEDLFVAIITMCILTVLVTPFVVRVIFKPKKREIELKDHIVILGCGRIGGFVADALLATDEEFIVVDKNLRLIEEMRIKSVVCIYGDAADIDVLKNAGVHQAKLVVAALPARRDAVIAVKHIKRLNDDCYIIARAHGKEEYELLKDSANEVVQPELISGLNVFLHVLEFLGIREIDVRDYIKEVEEEGILDDNTENNEKL